MSEKPRILILTLSFGAGHISAAQAVVAELKKQIPKADVRTIDALQNCSLGFRAFYVWTYWAMIRYAPRLWNKFFASRVERRDEQTAPVWMWRKGCKKVFAEIEIFQPDVIIACEVGASEIAVIARRSNLTNAAIVNVITDYEAEPIWVKPEIAAYAVAAENVQEQLENWGAKSEIIKVCGIPLDASFSETHYASQIKSSFNLDARPIVLLMGGGMGPTRMDEVAAHILEKGENLNIVALPGKDKRAKAALEELQNRETVSLRVINWTNEVAALMQTADVLATKPGGVTLSEAAACGVPLVLFDAIPGPETANAAHFAAAEAAVNTHGSDQTVSEILRLLGDRGSLNRMAANVRKLARTDAATVIARMVKEIIEHSPERESVWQESERMESYRKAFLLWREADEKSALARQNKLGS